MELELFAKLADDKNKVEKIIVFICLLIIEVIFSFWIASLFGYNYDGSELNFKNITMFFSSYQILIPIFSFLSSYVLFNAVMPIALFSLHGRIFKKALNNDKEFRDILEYLGIIGGDVEDYNLLKEHYGKLISKEGQNNLYNMFVLYFSLCVLILPLCFIVSYWLFIPMVFLYIFTFLYMYGFFTIRTIYLRKTDLEKIIKNEYNRIIGEVSE